MQVTVKTDCSSQLAYASAYFKLKELKVDRTLEVNDRVNVDIDREGNLIGVEINLSLDPSDGSVDTGEVVSLKAVQRLIDKNFGLKFEAEFKAIEESPAIPERMVTA